MAKSVEYENGVIRDGAIVSYNVSDGYTEMGEVVAIPPFQRDGVRITGMVMVQINSDPNRLVPVDEIRGHWKDYEDYYKSLPDHATCPECRRSDCRGRKRENTWNGVCDFDKKSGEDAGN